MGLTSTPRRLTDLTRARCVHVPQLWAAALLNPLPALGVALEQGFLRTDAARRVGWGPQQVNRFKPFQQGGGCAGDERGPCKGIECIVSSL